jgi:glutaminase
MAIDAALPRVVERLHAELAGESAGEVATYIPELSKANPDHFGIAVVTTGGDTVMAGDSEVEFTMQSVSKAFTYCLLLDEAGRESVASIVGVQPSSEPFSAIELDPRTNRPFNPMLNAGAIAISARLREILGAGAFDHVLRVLGRAAGRDLRLDERVFQSELETGHRNRAIGHLLRNAGVFGIDVDAALDVYFRQCSVLVTARDLAMMGATLANIGTHPTTGAEVFGVAAVRDTLSVMFTCGMYDGAGDWACRVGLPAKSGVGGGVLAVVNRQLGIGTFSPRVDAVGNSIRGLRACVVLAEELGLHAFDCMNAGSSMVGSMLSGSR